VGESVSACAQNSKKAREQVNKPASEVHHHHHHLLLFIGMMIMMMMMMMMMHGGLFRLRLVLD
jgi:hypothetical protein